MNRYIALGTSCLVLALTSLVLSTPAYPDTEQPANLQQIAEKRIAGDSSRACIAIGRVQLLEDGAQLNREMAFACAEPSAEQPNAQTVFEIGSISKAMLGTIVASMSQQGRLDIEAPIKDYISTPVPGADDNPIRIRHLLTHSSGLPRLPNLQPADIDDPYAEFTREELLESLQHAALTSEPGEQFAYSNFGYMLLSMIVAEIAQEPLTELYKKRLFEPLGMVHSGFGIATIDGHHAHGEVAANWNFPFNMEGVGGVRSSLHDMLNFAQLMLGLGPAELVDAMQLAQQPLSIVEEQPMGWGWMHYRHNGHLYLVHGGGTGGFNAAIIADLDSAQAVVVLANGALYNTHDVQKLALHVLDPSVEPGMAHQVGEVPAELNLSDYEGNYPLMPGCVLKVFIEKDADDVPQLMLQATGQGAAPITYQQDDVFENLQYGVELHFERDDNNQVMALELRQHGQRLQGERQPLEADRGSDESD